MGVEIRAIGPDEFSSLRRSVGLAFGVEPDPEDQRLKSCLSLDRTRCAFDEGQIVGTSAAWSLDMSIPGGTVPCGGSTIVSVAPTHRRRGLMREIMGAHLDDVREHEEPIAALWATDSAIYGRFGFGTASISHDIEVKRGHVDMHRLAPEPAPVRIIDAAEAGRVLPPFFDSIRAQIPGYIRRWPDWWEHFRFYDPERERHGMTPFRYAVVSGDDGIAGFAQYRSKLEFRDDHGAGQVVVRELVGTTPASWAGLWSFILGHDLIEKVSADHRPPWDPLFDLLAGTRRVSAPRADSLWVRIMDLPAALEARAYSSPLEVVISVLDPFRETGGTYRLSVDGDGASCVPVDDEPDAALDLEDLSACYLGRARFKELARAGRVSGDGATLTAMDAAFTWEPQPWCPEVF